MADPLSMLRDFNITKREIVERDDLIIFGDIAFKKSANTNYLVYGLNEQSENKDYYTLGCLAYFLKTQKTHPTHPQYVRAATSEHIPVVSRPDRAQLEQYLKGEITTSDRIDRYAHVELPVPFNKRPAEEDKPATRKPRVDAEKSARDREQERQQRAAKFDAQKEQGVTISAGNIGKLSDTLTEDKLAILRLKRRAQKRNAIRTDTDDTVGDLPVADLESDGLQEILSRERIGRTRADVTKGTKDLSARIGPIFAMIKAKEDGKKIDAQVKAQQSKAAIPAAKSSAPAVYSRYDQEQFNKDNVTDFGINTMSSYRGAQSSKADAANKSAVDSTAPTTPDSQRKKASPNPIIIVPSAPSSMITMYNCVDILQDNKFIESDVKKKSGTKYEPSVYIQRKNQDGTVRAAIKVIDNPNFLSGDEWDRVVAVFVQGAAWQFKGWPWNGNPVEIFEKIKAFHIKFDEMPVEKTIANWNVQVLSLSRTKRHLDRASLLKFWETMDKFMLKSKPSLRW
ncbi:Parafibromin [Hypsibius exemplaris]|uniref:Parafibromin n=1 Tax=Hypsibius exemplaris TaxID=2072580 RepID=A0A1W0XDP6_HYPEX|nr:Parafibromin [Hypsibius exemplaris]